jgi:nucleoside-diphosphate-sugar epimerase
VRVLVAGATGDVGRPTVRRLRQAGHEVDALTRSPAKVGHLQRLGARPVVANVLDADAARVAVETARPEAIVDLLTALPRRGPVRPSDLEATNRLRERATATLVEAARASGVRRYVAESIVFVYGYGDRGPRALTEEDPPAPVDEVSGPYLPALRAARGKERRVTEEVPEGIAIRFGVFYGPHTGSTRYIARMLRRRMLGLPGGGRGLVPWVHVEDAAAATVSALERGNPGVVYNVVDDEAASFRDFTEALARAADLPRPYGVPEWLVRPVFPYAVLFMSRTRLVVSNVLAKRDLGWRPAFTTYQEGVLDVAASLRGRTTGRSAPS